MTTKTTGSFNNNTTPPVDAQYLNILRDEMNTLSVIDGTTLDTTGTVNSQQAQAVKAYVSQAGILCTDSGSSANSYILTASSPFTNPPLKTGTRVRFKTANSNTGSSTITPFGGSAITCKKSDGSTNLTTGDIPANTEVEFVYNGTNFVQSIGKVPATTTTQGVAFLSNPITISNNATDANNDIDFSAGNFILNNGSGQGLLTTALTKRLDASWVAGTNQGGLLSGTKAINSTYHWFAIQKPDGTIDVGAILGVNGTTPDPTSVLPSGYTAFSKNPIVSVITDGSGNILNGDFNFKNNGNYIFNLNVDNLIFYRTNTVVSGLQAITIPAGIKVQAHCGLYMAIASGSSGTNGYATAQDFNKTTVITNSVAVTKQSSFTFEDYAKVWAVSNTSQQIWFASSGTTSQNSVGLYTLGWKTIY
jgi:hypothetical protein